MALEVELAVEDATASETLVTSLALSVGPDEVRVDGRDVVGGSIPVFARGETTVEEFAEGKTYGRIVRLADLGTSNAFYDVGIDKDGDLFVNSKSSTQSNHVLTISPSGEVTINAQVGLKFSGLRSLGGRGIVNLVFDQHTGDIGHAETAP